jgi:hypothetical protein
MSIEQNKATVLQFYKAFDNRNIDQALALLAPNFTAHLAGIPEPLEQESFKQFGMTFYLAFANSQHSFDEVIVAGDKVLTLSGLKPRRFFVHRPNLPWQDCSNQSRGRISRSVRVYDPSSHMTCGTQG